MKIDVGSGHRPHKGYKTIEIQASFNPDYLGDFRTMSFSDIEVIRAHHILEHFGRDDGYKVLVLWHSWLKVGGLLVVETPDFEGICKTFLERKDGRTRWWIVKHTYGSQEADWAHHLDGWYEDKFRIVLKELGFEIIDVIYSTVHGFLPNITVTAKKIK